MGYSDSASGTPARLKAADGHSHRKGRCVCSGSKVIVRMVDQGTQMEGETGWSCTEGALSTSRNKRDNSKGDEETSSFIPDTEESTSLDRVADMGVCAPKDGEENGNNVDDEDDDPALLKRRQRVRRLHHWRTQR